MAAGLSGLGTVTVDFNESNQLQVLGMKHPLEQAPSLSPVAVLD